MNADSGNHTPVCDPRQVRVSFRIVGGLYRRFRVLTTATQKRHIYYPLSPFVASKCLIKASPIFLKALPITQHVIILKCSPMTESAFP